jgi:predicted DNA-binding transcriptional regulator YafY
MFHQGYRTEEEIWPIQLPQFDAVAIASRKVDPKILRSVLDAIDAEACLEVRYVSLSSSSENTRMLCPHAIASDGHRWHMRAYDVEKDQFSDFVLSRIEAASVSQEDCPHPRPDAQWQQITALKLQADPALNARQREQVEIEYSMVDGVLELPVRKAMLFYYLRFYGFDPLEMDGNVMRNKSSYRLKILNLEEVEVCLERRK